MNRMIAQPNIQQVVEQFIVGYYTTYAYNRGEISKFYDQNATISRPNFHTNSSIHISVCGDLSFSSPSEHISILNYVYLPNPAKFEFIIVVSGRIDDFDQQKFTFFNQTFWLAPYNFYNAYVKYMISADSVVFVDSEVKQLGNDYFECLPSSLPSSPINDDNRAMQQPFQPQQPTFQPQQQAFQPQPPGFQSQPPGFSPQQQNFQLQQQNFQLQQQKLSFKNKLQQQISINPHMNH